MQQTKITTLLWVALIAAPIGWTISRIVDSATYALPPVPWVMPILLVFLAIVLELLGRAAGAWVRERRFDEQLDALRVARVVVVAKATAVFGAALAGGYVGLGLLATGSLDVPMGRNRLLMSGLVIVVAVFAVVAAIRCERACQVPPPSDDNNQDQTN